MQIALDGIPLATPKSGIGHYTFELAKSLAEISPADAFELIAHVELDRHDNELPRNLTVQYVPVNTLTRRWWTIGLPLYVRRQQLSLYHGTNYNIPLWRQCPSVVTVHDLSLLLYPETHREDLVMRARRRLPTMTRIADHVITDSASVKREIHEHLGTAEEKVTVVPLAPRRIFQPSNPQEIRETLKRFKVEDQFILFVGTVEPRKNLLTLVRAFDELMRETDLRPQLVIAGQKGWLTDELYKHVEQSALKERVLFTGYISDEDLRALYSACLVSVYPSLYEGFGLPPLEAMACGAPVITSRIPVIMETSDGAAQLIDPTNVKELTSALVELLTSEDRRQQLSEKGLQRAAEYTWERTAQQTLKVYRDVLKSTSLP
jgi:glycosyltransferase involved in cell wall biosynthesis